jgi:hypothetical protein
MNTIVSLFYGISFVSFGLAACVVIKRKRG